MKILLLSTGGTISSKNNPSDDKGAVPSMGTEEFSENLEPYLKEIGVELETYDFSLVPGHFLRLHDLLSLSKLIKSFVSRDDINGVVVSIGTAAIEEASYFCDLSYEGSKPVVFTGAMRHPGGPSSDMIVNLRDSIVIAKDKRVNDFGVVVYLNGEMHSAIDAVKTNTTLISAIKSVNTGPLGYVSEGKLFLLSTINFRRESFHPQPSSISSIDVPIIKCTLGMDENIVEQILFGTENLGVVFEVQASGQVTPKLAALIERYLKETGKSVIVASRTRSGPMRESTYGYQGGELHLQKIGAILAHFTTSEKARIKLILAVNFGLSAVDLKKIFKVG